MKAKDFSGIRNNGPLPNPQEMEMPEDFSDLLDDYVESTNSSLDELEQVTLAYEAANDREGNAVTIRRILHKIKGESAMVGIDEMSDFCHQAEFAFEELTEDKRPDMLLRFKDWTCTALHNLAERI